MRYFLLMLVVGCSVATMPIFSQNMNSSVMVPKVNLSDTLDVSSISDLSLHLIVYNTNTGMIGGNGVGLYYHDGHKWIYLIPPSAAPSSSTFFAKSSSNDPPPTVLVHGPKTVVIQMSAGFITDPPADDPTNLYYCRCVRKDEDDAYPSEITNELDASGNPCSGTACGTTRNLRNCSIDCNNLNYNGNTDWRMPSGAELINLINIAPGNTSSRDVWTLNFNN